MPTLENTLLAKLLWWDQHNLCGSACLVLLNGCEPLRPSAVTGEIIESYFALSKRICYHNAGFIGE